MHEYKIVFTKEAERDLVGIYEYVKDASSEWDAKVAIAKIRDKINTFHLFPERSEPFIVDANGLPLRITVGGRYRAVYAVSRELREVAIIRIISVAQDLDKVFKK